MQAPAGGSEGRATWSASPLWGRGLPEPWEGSVQLKASCLPVTGHRAYPSCLSQEYSIVIEQLSDGKWVPFDGDDIQLRVCPHRSFCEDLLERER